MASKGVLKKTPNMRAMVNIFAKGSCNSERESLAWGQTDLTDLTYLWPGKD